MDRRPLLRALVVLAAIVLGWLLRGITVPLLAAYLLMLALTPLNRRLEPRIGTTLAALASLVIFLLTPMLLALPTLLETEELGRLLPTSDQVSDLGAGIVQQIDKLQQSLPESMSGALDLEDERVQQFVSRLAAWATDALAAVVAFLGGVFGIFSGLVLVPIFAFFLLAGEPWLPKIRREVPPEWHPRFDRVLPRIEEILRLFCVSRILVAAAKALIFFAILMIGNIPGAYTLSLIAGFASLLPVVGPFVATLGLAVVAFASHGVFGLVIAGVAYAVAEFAEGYVLLPKLVGKGLGLSDFAVLLAVFAGGALLGIFGMIAAIPLMAVGKVLYDEYLRPVMGTEDDAAAPTCAAGAGSGEAG